MRLLHGSIRQRVSLLVFIPIVSLVGVYAYAVATTVGDAIRLSHATTVTADLREPNTNVQQQLDTEGTYALFYLAVPNRSNLAVLRRQEYLTDQAVKVWHFFAASPTVNADIAPRERRAIARLAAGLGRLAAVRSAVAHRSITLLSALGFYNGLEISGFLVYDGWIEQATSVPLVADGLYLTKLGEAEQAAVDENDLLLAALAIRSFTPAERAEFTSLAAVRRFLVAQSAPELGAPFKGFYARYVSAATGARLAGFETRVISGRRVHGLPPVRSGPWFRTAIAYIDDLEAMLGKSGDVITAEAQAQADATYRRLGLIGGLGLLAIIASAGISWAVGRRIVRQLDDLRTSAVDVASYELPEVMAALRANQAVDLPSGRGPRAAAHGHEIGQVWQAFRLLQQAAVGAAIEEARLRRGVSLLFQSLARRSQSLLHRQLALLDRMEREAEQPEELDKLFRIDHLTTRMRRHAESLIVLSGEAPARGWKHPVPLDDVLRAAVAEVEDYARIRVLVRTKAALAGQAVADVIHLVAELAENATIFSPPNTPVRILGDVGGRGFTIEVEDRGVGMTPDQIEHANRDLADPPEFDLAEGDHLGLLIAGKLAQRHGIKITLRDSPFGGTEAIVLIPATLVLNGELATPPRDPITSNGDPARFPGRHSAARGHGDAGTTVDVLPAPAALAPSRQAPDSAYDDLPYPGDNLPYTDPGLPHTDPGPPYPGPDLTDDLPYPDVDENGHLIGLPTRVPQASLAPQLRDDPDPGPGPDPDPGYDPDPDYGRAVSPEDARRAMTDLQRGWHRGWTDSGPRDAGS